MGQEHKHGAGGIRGYERVVQFELNAVFKDTQENVLRYVRIFLCSVVLPILKTGSKHARLLPPIRRAHRPVTGRENPLHVRATARKEKQKHYVLILIILSLVLGAKHA